jgi:hypothetical protein
LCSAEREAKVRTSEVIDSYRDKNLKITCRTFGEYILIEGSEEALEFLGKLFLAQAKETDNCCFWLSPFGAGCAYFTEKSNRGLYIHRLPCDQGELSNPSVWGRPESRMTLKPAKFKDIYKRVLGLWPSEIDLTEGYLVKETDKYYCRNLARALDEAEAKVDPTNEWDMLMVWTLYGVLHARAKIIALKGRSKCIYLTKIPISRIKSMYIKDLQSEGFEDMLEMFKIANLDCFKEMRHKK